MRIKNNKDIINAIGKTVTLGTIDMYGMLGRDNHPKASMKGMKVKIVGICEVAISDGDFTNDIGEIASGKVKYSPSDSTWVCFNTLTPGGQMFEIMDYEISD